MPPIRTSAPRTPRASSTGALARCVEPTPAEEFLAEYWEQRPLVALRDGETSYDDLLSEDDVERLVTSGELRHPAFRLVKAGEKLRLGDYSTDIPWRPSAFRGVADAERVAAAFADGATIVVQGLHHWWRPLSLFCRALEADLGEPAQANAYYTPRGSQGLPVHHDTHDVFVLQVAGEKRWLVYEPALELPLKDQRYSEAEHGAPGEVVKDVTLRAGDTLYLPRGWLHEAVTSGSDSLHLTIGVNLYTWSDALRGALRELASEVDLRRSVPEDGSGGRELLDLLAERLEPEEVARRKARKLVHGRRPILDGQLRQLRAVEGLTADTEVERRPEVLYLLEEGVDGGRVRLSFSGKSLTFPARAHDELEALAEADDPVTARDLPGGLDEAGRLVLVRRLVREGFLRLARLG
jgi:ribosomal protein L16 Arg81 hydroxylase